MCVNVIFLNPCKIQQVADLLKGSVLAKPDRIVSMLAE
jgi:hypothetical protein